MMCSWWLYGIALLAPPHSLLQHPVFGLIVALSFISDHFTNPAFGARFYKTGTIVAPPYPKYKYIKPYSFCLCQGARLDVVEEVLRGVGEEEDEDGDPWYCKVFERCEWPRWANPEHGD
jgi:hypothetical protein